MPEFLFSAVDEDGVQMLVDWGKMREVVLDFDCTITLEHTGGRADSAEELLCEYIKNNTKSVFVEFVQESMRQGIELWIATYGDDGFAQNSDDVAGHELVKRYMNVLFGPDQRLFREPKRDEQRNITAYHNVIARCSGDRKAFHWDIIRMQMGTNFHPDEILFLDDSQSNLDYAAELGCQLMVPGSSDTSARVCASKELFTLLLDRMRVKGVTDAVE